MLSKDVTFVLITQCNHKIKTSMTSEVSQEARFDVHLAMYCLRDLEQFMPFCSDVSGLKCWNS